jgi:hypothetical protein
MPRVGRNELCSCGSGLKVKRCCGVARGPSAESLASGFLRTAAREVAGSAGALSEREFALLLAELVDLPCLDLSLQVELPKLLSPTLGRLCEAIAEDDELAGEAVLDEVLGELDTPVERARLARAVIAYLCRGSASSARGWFVGSDVAGVPAGRGHGGGAGCGARGRPGLSRSAASPCGGSVT